MAMMTGEDLKNSILQMAMQGKLVEQRPEEGTGEELYREIQAENARLIREGIIGKPRRGNVYNDGFDYPGSWKVCSLQEVCSLEKGKKAQCAANLPYLEAQYLRGNKEAVIKSSGDVVYKDQLVILVDGENSGEVFTLHEDGILGSTFKVLYINTYVEKNYVLYVLDYYRPLFRNKKKGAAIPHLDKELFAFSPIGIPPLAEQKRIIAKIEELMPFVEQYSKAADTLTALNTSFPSDLKKSILQLAVEGKLVPQDPTDEPASVLLEKIRAEKERLVKEGKIKKQKKLPEITEDEIPFDIPESWEWCRLSDVAKSIVDGDHMPPPQSPKGVPFLVISNLSSGTINFLDTRHVPKDYYDGLSSERKAENGDVLFTVTGSFGIPVKVETDQKFCFQRHMALIKPLLNNDFLMAVLRSPLIQKQCDDVATGTAQRTVGIASLRNMIIPIPPQEEQKRIVQRLEKLMPVIDSVNMSS